MTNLFRNIYEKVRRSGTDDSSLESADIGPTKEALAEKVMYLLIDATNELLPESNNALIRDDKYRANGIWDGYLKELVGGKSPVFYIDTGGITRMNYHNKELHIVHSGEMPSKIPGKTIRDVWTEVKDKYNPKVSELMDDLNIQ